MTYTELTAAMWDGRSVTLTDHAGRSIEAVPTSITRCIGRDRLWAVGYYARHKRPPRGAIVMRFDSFDGH
jgi:hypothetical protein